jgi:hypothetical protein
MAAASRYDRVFRNTLVAFVVFFVLFLIGLYFILELSFPSGSGGAIAQKGYFSVFITGPVCIGAAYILFQLHRQHQKFKNTGYDYPYPKDV